MINLCVLHSKTFTILQVAFGRSDAPSVTTTRRRRSITAVTAGFTRRPPPSIFSSVSSAILRPRCHGNCVTTTSRLTRTFPRPPCCRVLPPAMPPRRHFTDFLSDPLAPPRLDTLLSTTTTTAHFLCLELTGLATLSL